MFLALLFLFNGIVIGWITYAKKEYMSLYEIRTFAGASLLCLLLSVFFFWLYQQ
jgi:hypothetical protein